MLTASVNFSPAGASYTYQWQRRTHGTTTWNSIAGATASSYTLTVADEGQDIAVTPPPPTRTETPAQPPARSAP